MKSVSYTHLDVYKRQVEKDIIQAKKDNHISFGEYAWTGFYDLTQEQKKTVSTLWSRMEFRKKFTDRRYIGMLMNKYKMCIRDRFIRASAISSGAPLDGRNR